jgi:hypothetical protein
LSATIWFNTKTHRRCMEVFKKANGCQQRRRELVIMIALHVM